MNKNDEEFLIFPTKALNEIIEKFKSRKMTESSWRVWLYLSQRIAEQKDKTGYRTTSKQLGKALNIHRMTIYRCLEQLKDEDILEVAYRLEYADGTVKESKEWKKCLKQSKDTGGVMIPMCIRLKKRMFFQPNETRL